MNRLIGVLAQVDVSPNSTGMPGAELIQKLLNIFFRFTLLAKMAHKKGFQDRLEDRNHVLQAILKVAGGYSGSKRLSAPLHVRKHSVHNGIFGLDVCHHDVSTAIRAPSRQSEDRVV